MPQIPTKPSFKGASAQTYTSTGQISPSEFADLSSLAHIDQVDRQNRKNKKKSRENSKRRGKGHQPSTGFAGVPVGNRFTLYKTNKIKKEKINKLKRSVRVRGQALPNGSDADGGLNFTTQLVKWGWQIHQEDLTPGESNMRQTLINDPSLIRLVRATRKRLTSTKLKLPDEFETINFAMQEICLYSKINETSIVTKEDRTLFAEETDALVFILKTPFKKHDSFVNQGRHSLDLFLYGQGGRFYLWNKLHRKFFDFFKSDIALQLVDLERDFGRQSPYFQLAANVRSFVPEYFENQVLESFKVVQESIDLSENEFTSAERCARFTSLKNELKKIRSQSLIGRYNQKFPNKQPYQQVFCSATGQKHRMESRREPFNSDEFVTSLLPLL